MGSSYVRQDRKFRAKIAERADELRSKRDAEQIVEMIRDLQDELFPVLVMLWQTQETVPSK